MYITYRWRAYPAKRSSNFGFGGAKQKEKAKRFKNSALTVPDNLSGRDGRAVWREELNASVTVIIFFCLLHEKTSFIWLTEHRVSSSGRIAAEQSEDVKNLHPVQLADGCAGRKKEQSTAARRQYQKREGETNEHDTIGNSRV